MSDFPPFPGFRAEAFQFLRDLSRNNDRDWFKPRKEIYDDEVLWPLRCLVADVSRRANEAGVPLGGDPKGAVFRIYRDIRFSKDKRPYKTHAAAFFTRTGVRDVHSGGFYFHFEPEKSFMGAGFWRVGMPLLRRWRGAMAANPSAFLQVVQELEEAGLNVDSDEKLKRLPRGLDVDEDAPIAPYTKWKSFLASRQIPDEEGEVPDTGAQIFLDHCASCHGEDARGIDVIGAPNLTDDAWIYGGDDATMRETLPLLEYGWEVEGQAAEAT